VSSSTPDGGSPARLVGSESCSYLSSGSYSYNKDYPLPVRKSTIIKGRQIPHLKVVITKGEDGWYVVTVPPLPGCITQGRTIKEAKQNIKEAISLYLEPDEDMIPGKGARVIEVAVWSIFTGSVFHQ
jgi:predicted RNase H-like HicB family nuclease